MLVGRLIQKKARNFLILQTKTLQKRKFLSYKLYNLLIKVSWKPYATAQYAARFAFIIRFIKAY